MADEETQPEIPDKLAVPEEEIPEPQVPEVEEREIDLDEIEAIFSAEEVPDEMPDPGEVFLSDGPFVQAGDGIIAETTPAGTIVQLDRLPVPMLPSTLAAKNGVITIQNDSGLALPAYSVVKLNGPVETPTENLIGFQSDVVMHAIVPTAIMEKPGLTTGRHYWDGLPIAITQHVIPIGGMGKAMIRGITPCQVAARPTAKFAGPYNGDHTKLKADVTEGPARIVWQEATTLYTNPVSWAIVDLQNTPIETAYFRIIDGRTVGQTYCYENDDTCSAWWVEQTFYQEGTIASFTADPIAGSLTRTSDGTYIPFQVYAQDNSYRHWLPYKPGTVLKAVRMGTGPSDGDWWAMSHLVDIQPSLFEVKVISLGAGNFVGEFWPNLEGGSTGYRQTIKLPTSYAGASYYPTIAVDTVLRVGYCRPYNAARYEFYDTTPRIPVFTTGGIGDAGSRQLTVDTSNNRLFVTHVDP